ncbi:Glycine receptor subunit alpha1like [Caligus rogercresseyi]|uniref:Glycine receptor subunit alpha1like n=1 Tax=Caligus rogercresseyi TaxID=217165 RepID=A0A7T8HHT8_CALRO|nr:Glycine receptor subunit alpha1like [Caligus rogercresseyi]QQP50056.1 Glycine receptor subunit alpha1like [Caligus rogercresseyi]
MSIPLAWNDSRITINTDAAVPNNPLKNGPPIPWYILDSNYMNILWLPHIHISNLKKFETPSLMVFAEDSRTKMLYMGDHLVSMSCPMAFDDFPFDTHNCFFEVKRMEKSSN